MVLIGMLCASPIPHPASLASQTPHPGKAPYDQWCAGCHGDTGAGDGEAAAYMLPRPRDFTKGVYQIRTTASGEIPTDADLRRVVDEGMPGTAMPGWTGTLSERQRADVVAYIKSFSRFFTNQTATAIPISGGGGRGDVATEGPQVYQKLECFKCHGEAGRGDGNSAPSLTDDWDHPIRAADLTESWHFNGGSTVEQIYTRLRTGLDGTPMPSYADAVEGNLVTDDQLWQLARYVRSLSPEKPPEAREVVRAARVEGNLPANPGDSAWEAAERFYVPLVGQIIIKPRWFSPTVDGVWVQAMHNGERLAIRLTWHDPSRSPDAAWDEWLGRIRQTMTDADGVIPEAQGPDRFVLQFPTSVQEGDRPYFLGGSQRRPAYVWRWASTPDAVQEGSSTGLGRFAAQSGAAQVVHAAVYDRGEWRVQFSRALVPADTASSPTFTPGRAIPVAFFAADGSNGEGEVRGSASAWYAIYLDVPTSSLVYAAPITTTLLTVALGLLMVRQAKRRGPDSERSSLEES
jgi:DMSO reductase family type II enzyme heme b subunit